jgi:type VI protein secretion system component VasF
MPDLEHAMKQSEPLDKSQAEAIADVMLKPDPAVRDALARKRLAEAQSLRERRTVAWFVLAGAVLGAAVAYFTGHRFSNGALYGGTASSAVGWLYVLWRRYAR